MIAQILRNSAIGQKQKEFCKGEQNTWQLVLETHHKVRENQIIDIFHSGLKVLEITSDKIPSLESINKKLKDITGFQGVFVDGLEDGSRFYMMLANRQFPVGNFIRDKEDLSYTPAPDIIHDLYGHLPFFVNKNYSDFCQKFGEMACEFLDKPDQLRQFERFFWFTIEFGLIKTKLGRRIFGAGIASSLGECEYSLSEKPNVIPFDVDVIRHQEFNIDKMQKKLFLLESREQLYSSLNDLYQKVKSGQ